MRSYSSNETVRGAASRTVATQGRVHNGWFAAGMRQTRLVNQVGRNVQLVVITETPRPVCRVGSKRLVRPVGPAVQRTSSVGGVAFGRLLNVRSVRYAIAGRRWWGGCRPEPRRWGGRCSQPSVAGGGRCRAVGGVTMLARWVNQKTTFVNQRPTGCPSGSCLLKRIQRTQPCPVVPMSGKRRNVLSNVQ